MSNNTVDPQPKLGPKAQARNGIHPTRSALSDGSFLFRFSPPRVPDFDGLSLRDAALAYAKAGWFVLPVAPESKNPGSVVGRGWQDQSSRDSEQIADWWNENPHYGIALHAGRSGAVVFDLDNASLDQLPAGLADSLRHGQIQLSRRDNLDRGHYLFWNDAGYGNGAGSFRPFGEVRGKNGVIIAAPTPHVADDGEYRWTTSGAIPALPDALRRCLSAAPEREAEPLDDAELAAFLEKHTSADRPNALDGVVDWFASNVSGGMSRHEALINALPWAFREAAAGLYPAMTATERLQDAFQSSFRADVGGRRSPAPNEFAKTAQWAAAKAQLTDPADTLARVNRDDPAGAVVDEEAFWTARPELERLRDFARSRMVGPWSMFGAVAARAITTIPPRVVLPAVVGSVAPLNSFFVLVGASGLGKGASEAAAEDFLITGEEVFKSPAGSGEGVVKLFAFRGKASEPQTSLREAVLISVDEIDGFAAQTQRSGGTILPTMRSAWTGADLGFSYSDQTKKIFLKKHRYRLTMLMGVQPEHSGPLFDDGDGGLPQRLVWLSTDDPEAPDDLVAEPAPLRLPLWPSADPLTHEGEDGEVTFSVSSRVALLDVPLSPAALEVLAIPEQVKEDIREQRRKTLRGEVQGLDGHAMLVQLKLAACLMWLDGRTDKVTESDWDLAAVVMAVSNRTRARTQKTLEAKAAVVNRGRGRGDAEREDAKAGVLEDKAIRRVAERIRAILREAAGPMVAGAVRRRIAARDRDYFDLAVLRLEAVGDVTQERFTRNGQKGTRLSLSEGR